MLLGHKKTGPGEKTDTVELKRARDVGLDEVSGERCDGRIEQMRSKSISAVKIGGRDDGRKKK